MAATAARLVCANHDRVSQLSHVWEAMGQCLDYSRAWTLERAAAQGLPFLVQHLARRTASALPQETDDKSLAMDFAAGNGHLAILTWLHDTQQLSSCSTRAMDDAAKNGHSAIVQWLHVHRSEGCTTRAMDYAASNGHLSVVQWLHEHRSEGSTPRAMDLAAQNGHLHVLQWLHDNRSEGCTVSAVDYAATEGHLHIVRWLCDVRKEVCSSGAMVGAARGGHVSILQYLSKQFATLFESVSAKMMHAAVANGQRAVLEWLAAVLPVKSLKCEEAAGSWMEVACQYGQTGTLKWFHDHAAELPMDVDKHSACTAAAVVNAARNGHDDVLVYLQENDLIDLTTESSAMDALVAAVEGGHRNCVKWLVTTFRTLYATVPCTTTTAMDTAAASGHVDLLQFLRDERTTTKWRTSYKAVERAARYGFVDVLRWLHLDDHSNAVEEGVRLQVEEANRPERRWTSMALEMAATNGHLAVVQWLIEHHRNVCSSVEAFNAACYMDHVPVAQYLYSNVRSSCSVEQALEQANEGGAEDTLCWLQGLPI